MKTSKRVSVEAISIKGRCMKVFKKASVVVVLAFAITIGLAGLSSAATTVNLGTADSFAVLAGTAVTNVPTSTITWDVGLSPAAGSNYAGLTAAQVAGTIYAVDATGPAGSVDNPGLLTTAKTDLVSAYDALSAGDNATCDTTYAGTKDLVGLSLVPGVYCAGAFELSGTLTLEGSGVWIFRSADTLITSGTANVVGGDPCNVWWKVPSSATLGTNTSLIGNILALTSITLNTGASLNGRALARNAAVTLDQNTITNVTCAAAPTPTPGPSPTPTTVTQLPSTGIHTGISADENSIPLNIAILLAGIFTVSILFKVARRKK